MERKQVILLGKGDLAIKIGEWFLASKDYILIAVVPTIPAPSWTSSLPEWAHSQRIRLVESGDYRDLPMLRDPSWRPQLAFSVFYDRIIRGDFINRCDRILNLHLAPLPRYRGMSPINWALKEGEQFHGVTIHEIVEARASKRVSVYCWRKLRRIALSQFLAHQAARRPKTRWCPSGAKERLAARLCRHEEATMRPAASA